MQSAGEGIATCTCINTLTVDPRETDKARSRLALVSSIPWPQPQPSPYAFPYVESPPGSQKSLHAGSVPHRRFSTPACGGFSGDVTTVVCTVQRSHLCTTVLPLKNDGGPTVERRYGHHRLNGAQFQRYGKNFLTRTVHPLQHTGGTF